METGMIRKRMKRTNLSLSPISFGVMRLPEYEVNGEMKVDREKSLEVLRYGAQSGINFFDTHPLYCQGLSEPILGEALEGLPGQIHVMTKCALWKELEPGESWRDRIESSLRNLRRDYMDIYLAHALTWEIYDKRGREFLKEAMAARDEDIIGHIGFSSHDTPENVMKLLDVDEFECMLVQYNLIDRSYEPCIERAAERGCDVFVMGPLNGGLFRQFPTGLKEATPERLASAAALALAFVLGNPAVDVALSGMDRKEQVDENLRTLESLPRLSPEEWRLVNEQIAALKERANVLCTRCRYCMPCPQGVWIPLIFGALAIKTVYGNTSQALHIYNFARQPGPDGRSRGPESCIECGQCEPKCPQKIPIMEQLKEARRVFEG